MNSIINHTLLTMALGVIGTLGFMRFSEIITDAVMAAWSAIRRHVHSHMKEVSV